MDKMDGLKNQKALVLIGRDPSCDVVITHVSVSASHARVGLETGGLYIEDLGSTNGTWVDGESIRKVFVRPGQSVKLGKAELDWTLAPLRRLVREHRAQRAVAPTMASESAVALGIGHRRTGPSMVTWLAATTVAALLVGLAYWVSGRSVASQSMVDPGQVSVAEPVVAALANPTALAIASAIDDEHPTTRNTAVRLAAEHQGPFHVEQVALLWTEVRRRWRYVNDPRGTEYFALASETIDNNYVGDCDDFATVLAAMITAIGGQARVVVMENGTGGHAYAEVCIPEPPDRVAAELTPRYRRAWRRYLDRTAMTGIHYRTDSDCPTWLNLDWTALVPGGPYQNETRALGIDPDGRTQELAPARGTARANATPN